jgi:hypothetical protein
MTTKQKLPKGLEFLTMMNIKISLLECGAIQSGRKVSTFQKYMLPPSPVLKMEPAGTNLPDYMVSHPRTQ